jgi:hypothetical protein
LPSWREFRYVPPNGKLPTTEPARRQSVFLHVPLQSGDYGSAEERDRVRAVARSLEQAVRACDGGSYDGDEWGGGECVLRFYAADADAILASVRLCLRGSSLERRAYAVIRRGSVDDPAAHRERVRIVEH